MGKILLAFILFYAKIAFPQVVDSFNDGDFTQNPVWQGDVGSYFVNPTKQLQTVNSGKAETVYLSTSNKLALNAKWDFFLQMNFDPSTSNFCRVYLVSDQADLNGPLNGYFLQVGESGANDSYDLYRQSGTTIVKIIDGPEKIRGTTELKARLQVTRDALGLWEIKTDIGGGTNYISEGTVTDLTFLSTNFFGVRSTYTTTRSGQHFYDEISITELVPDLAAPVLNSVNIAYGKTINLFFDEALDASEATKASNYIINPGNIIPLSANVNGTIVTLHLSDELNTASYTLTAKNARDFKGNTASPQSKSFYYKKPYTAKFNDIVINEIFADPSPQVDLPSVEFIELWNRSDEGIALVGLKYSDLTSTYTFTGDSIKAKEYLILCAKADTLEFKKYGKVIGISPWPSLNNASDYLKLINQNGTLISEVNYNDSWYGDALKKSGGWTLELIDPESSCKPSQMYAASADVTGGTPGKQNSIYLKNRTTEPLNLLSFSLKDSITATLLFNRGLDSLEASDATHYQINNGLGTPQFAQPLPPLFSSVELKYAQPVSRNKTYKLSVDGLKDCGVSTIQPQSLEYIYPALADKNEILINEVLFNPKVDGVDFVEIYNNSDKNFDFKDLKIAAISSGKDSLISIKKISNTSQIFPPKTYWVITSNPELVKNQYFTNHPDNFITLSLPAYSDDKGSVVILRDSVLLDQLDYNAKMHFALLKDLNGISLERSSFTQSTNASGNFRSATAASGYATPADKNSQYVEDSTGGTEEVSLASATFSPDNDGFEDALLIKYQFTDAGKVANVTIYDDQGRAIKKLSRNETLNAEGILSWDGFNDNNSIAKTGVYIIYFEIFELNGNVKKFKKTAVLASKLN